MQVYEDDSQPRYPDAKRHFYVSIIKSLIRIAGCVAALITPYDSHVPLLILICSFLIAEIWGIIEECL